ncbi:MAG: tRNA pseudouridine(38-40) synthase TruA [Candidatus Thermoplasmatota archaeon]|nr:tRNA pseudouridine(38-40) synthase TruA [Candidatus Thermoplasmatota archaeon]MCL5437787.1 tRNA pseudouridine(38-40) synthase TruA [Candidatus Thermoplasmatota archaeon]
MKLLIKFAYLGSNFTGFQRGNGTRSVEDSILEMIDKHGLGTGFRSAARTDRGVSALGNVLSLETDLKPQRVVGVLNSSVRNVTFHSYAIAGDDLDCRKCTSKQYRYVLPGDGIDVDRFRERAQRFLGLHDFSSFCRKDGRNTVRSIDKVEVESKGGMIHVDFHSRGFLWNQVRTMVSFAAYQGDDYPEDPFKIDGRFPYISPPWGLYLVDIMYDGITFAGHLGRRISGNLLSESVRRYVEHMVLDSLLHR